MTTFEIAFNIAALIITVASCWYLLRLVQTSGQDPIDDPERVDEFKRAAPYHLLERR